MPNTTDPDGRTARGAEARTDRPVTLINSFVVPAGRDDAFMALWNEASGYFRAQPGFVSLRFHRAVSPDADYRYVNVACWESQADFAAAHNSEEFRRLVTQDAWQEFASNPALYEVAVAVDADSMKRSTSASV
jgi:heme-degrading monooxygenase HmoA